MSLQNAAKYLAKQGRGKDTMLVHMSPKEVGSLQSLAMAHGGSLRVNPETGLPEAGFLDSLLPVLIGGGLMAATGGAAAPAFMGLSMPATIGLGVGGIQALRTGDIGKGITAGLGAYGGAGLAGGLMGAATAAQTPTAQALQSNIDPSMLEGMSAQQVAATGDMAQRAAMTGEGLGALGEKAGRTGFMGAIGGGSGLAKAGLAAASPFLTEEEGDMPQAKGSGPNPYRYRYERGEANPFPEISQTGIERSYFPNARYVAYAGGGPVETMSDANALGANTGFPMADIQRGAYATPYQQPISQNVVTGAQDTRTDPYTGAERFAEGGVAEQNPLLDTPYKKEPVDNLDSLYAGGNAPAVTSSTAPGQGISGIATGLGLGMMGLGEALGPIGIAGPVASAIGSGIAGGQADAMGEAANALGNISAMGQVAPGIVSMSDSQGNVVSVSSPASISAADVAMGLADAVAAASTSASSSSSAGVGGGTGSGSDGGTGDAGTATGDGGASGGDGGGGEANGGLLRRKYAMGGLSDLGGYSDGGRLLRGPGDGVSDSIPAVIGKRQPARLADGEFVVPARIVSELGNGSTEAGARKLYAMLDRVQRARGKTVGKGKVAKDSRADKYLPA